MPIYYAAKDGRCGDFVPFLWAGRYHLFYLHERGWEHLSTTDMLHFSEHPQAIAGGGEDDQDWLIATGSIIERDGLFYMFYCGANSRLPARGGFDQVLMRATSRDLDTWVKDPDWRLPPVLERYTAEAWRDPYVFWNAESQEYWMPITAQRKAGPAAALVTERRTGLGCVALFASPDLEHWEERPPLWTPGLYDAPECPDIFRIGDWWYLVFSEYRDVWTTHYRMARSPQGPWTAPADDCFDGRAFYAAKTVSDGVRRFLIGWLCTKEGERDAGKYEWGGSLLAHEIVQRQDGALGAKVAGEVADSFATACALSPRPELGEWRITGDSFIAQARTEFCFTRLAPLPDAFTFTTTIRWEPETQRCGVALRAGEPLNDWYMVYIEPGRAMLKFDRWLRAWDYPWMERPLPLVGSQAVLQVVMVGSEIVIYVDGTVALSGRAYDLRAGSLGLFVSEGAATFTDCRLSSKSVGPTE